MRKFYIYIYNKKIKIKKYHYAKLHKTILVYGVRFKNQY